MVSEIIFCTSCKKKDTTNKFDFRSVKITAEVGEGSNMHKECQDFMSKCAKCKFCGKILFTRMGLYRALKRQAEVYFKGQFPNEKIYLSKIDLT